MFFMQARPAPYILFGRKDTNKIRYNKETAFIFALIFKTLPLRGTRGALSGHIFFSLGT